MARGSTLREIHSHMVSVVLLGAGASFGSGEVAPCTPPLGNGVDGLFSRLETTGGEASRLPDHLKSMFRLDFEKGMSAYYEYSDGNIMRFQRELAAYLAQFTPGPTNAYVRLIKTLGVRRVIYSSLNYDLLFELAAAVLGLSTSYGSNLPACGVRLLKLHGSCNFWPDIPVGMIQRSTFFSRGGRADVQAPIRPLNQGETIHRCANDDSLAPAIAMYAEGKAVKVSPDYVKNQQVQWHSAIAAAKRVCVVGVRVHAADTHVWGALARTEALVTYFGRPSDKPAFLEWKAINAKKRAFFMEADFAECIGVMKSRFG